MHFSFFYKVHKCSKVIYDIFSTYTIFNILLLICIPFISSYLNLHVQRLFNKDAEHILYCMAFKVIYDYISFFVQSDVTYKQVRKISEHLILRMHLQKNHCGVSIPGVNQKQYKDISDESYKIRDFIVVLPMMWSSIVSFGISIYNMNTQSEYPLRTIFALLCIKMCIVLTYLSDASVYEKTKPNPNLITQFRDSNYVKYKISMGCKMDIDFEKNKKLKMDKQHIIQKYVIVFVNLMVTYISLNGKDISQLHAFSNISWMLGSLADNMKSLQYYEFVSEFIKLSKTFEKYKLESKLESKEVKKTSKTQINIDIDKIDFVKASFGYYSDDLTMNPIYIKKIKNLTFSFRKGVFYYLEATNGIGKSTLLKMFTLNLIQGNVFFGSLNRKLLSFEEINSSVFHVVQSSEYSPKFSTSEVKAYKGIDPLLEKQLGLSELLDKDSVEMSGGQKQKLIILMALLSNATVILFDEILSEISSEDTVEVPEGGGWLNRVVTTIINWPGRQNKIIILVGHGLLDLIPNSPEKKLVKLNFHKTSHKTMLIEKHKC